MTIRSYRHIAHFCHPELADLRTVERSENRLASRLSLLEQSSLGETLRAWSKSKTDSGSVQHCVLPVTPDRFRNGLARLAENVPTCFQHSALRSLAQFGMTPPVKAASCFGWSLKSHVQPLWMALSAFTMAARLSRFHNGLVGLRSAFTMAEILLSLTIIGVVAAITLPSLTGNINERTWNTQRKALYARFSQAIALMPALNGYGTLKEESSSGAGDAVDTATETFLSAGLSKVLKINNICDYEHLTDCGFVENIVNLGGSTISTPRTLGELNSKIIHISADSLTVTSSYSQIDTKAAAFETQNGETVIAYYNPFCQANMNELSTGNWYFVQRKVCANFIYDLNGNKGPNTVGKDIGFMSALYPTDSVIVAPFVVSSKEKDSVSYEEALKYCTSLDQEYRLPNVDELASMFFNQELMNIYDRFFWSSTVFDSRTTWMQSLNVGRRIRGDKIRDDASAVCVKRN